MGQMFIEQCRLNVFDPEGVVPYTYLYFCYKHLTHTGSANRCEYIEREVTQALLLH
jgi:hypothetical protein